MDPSFIERIRQNDPTLTDLDNLDYQLEKKDAKQLGQALAQNTIIQNVSFSYGVSHVKHILKGLMHNNSVRGLKFSANENVFEYGHVLVELLRKNQNIQSLDIHECLVNKATVDRLFETLYENRNIVSFSFFENRSVDEEYRFGIFIDLILKNNTIRHLDAGAFLLYTLEIHNFLKIMVQNTTIVSLFIDVRATNHDLLLCADIIRQNTTLNTLRMYADPDAYNFAKKAVADALQKNGMLTSIDTLGWSHKERNNYGKTGQIEIKDRVLRYLGRNKRAHARAKAAAMQVAALSLQTFPEQGEPEEDTKFLKQLDQSKDEHETTQLLRSLLEKTGRSGFRRSYFRQMAYYLWTSRGDPKWWTPEERREAGLQLEEELEPSTKRRGIESCISCQSLKPKFREEGASASRFCGSYCQWIKYTGAPDLRGKSPKEIKELL